MSYLTRRAREKWKLGGIKMSGSSALHAASLSMAVALPSNKVQMGLLGDGDDVGLGLRWASVIVGTCNCPYHSPSYVPMSLQPQIHMRLAHMYSASFACRMMAFRCGTSATPASFPAAIRRLRTAEHTMHCLSETRALPWRSSVIVCGAKASTQLVQHTPL